MINNFKKCLCGFIVFVVVLFVVLQSYLTDDDGVSANCNYPRSSFCEKQYLQEDGRENIIIWWTPFLGNIEYSRTCGSTRCLFTENRYLLDHSKLKVRLLHNKLISEMNVVTSLLNIFA